MTYLMDWGQIWCKKGNEQAFLKAYSKNKKSQLFSRLLLYIKNFLIRVSS